MRFLLVDKAKREAEPNPDKPRYAILRLQEALDEKGIEHELCLLDDISLQVTNGEFKIDVTVSSSRSAAEPAAESTTESVPATDKPIPLSEFTHIILRGHRNNAEYRLKAYVATYAQKHGIKVQNTNFMLKMPSYDKLIQMTMLAQAGLPYVDSYYCLDGRYHEKTEALERLGFPLIYKHIEGEYREEIIDGKPKLKKNVYLVNSAEELAAEIERRDPREDTYLHKPSKYFIQKFVDIGEDYRAIMLSGKFLSGWKRAATKGFLTVSEGSEYTLYDKPSAEFLELAESVNELFQADYCGIDIIYADGKPYVLEVNMNPGFKAFETKIEGCNVNVAKAIIESMVN